MIHVTYYDILEPKTGNRVLFDEVTQANEENRQKREFVEKNRLFKTQ